ncbi:hypothetical protein ACFE04_025038 [Oxalis oulophora]
MSSRVLSNVNLLSSSSTCSNQQEHNNNNTISYSRSVCPINRGFRQVLNSKLKSQAFRSDLYGNEFVLKEANDDLGFLKKHNFYLSVNSQTGLTIPKAQKWWLKNLKPNMKEVSSAQDLVDSLSNAGDKLVIVDFFSPGCGGCKALHPKICQFAEMNPDVQFLQVNFEEHKSMCYSLNVHVLPFFRFYRGAQGRVCSFSCTNATIKKFRDALAKHGTERCSLGPTKGLEEKELLALAANRDLSFTYTPKPEPAPAQEEEVVLVSESAPSDSKLPLSDPLPSFSSQEEEEKSLVAAGR